MNEKLEEIKIENFIIFIYYILLTIYLYANNIEIQYLKYQNEKDKEKYRLLLYVVFGTTFLITLYYTISDFKNTSNQETIQLQKLSTFANVLILIASIIYLYIIYKDEDINLEISP